MPVSDQSTILSSPWVRLFGVSESVASSVHASAKVPVNPALTTCIFARLIDVVLVRQIHIDFG